MRNSKSQDEIDGPTNTGTNVRSKWGNVIRPGQIQPEDRDEIDFSNGNRSDDEPVSLSAECLQDIHKLSQSMHNLIKNLNENDGRQYRINSSQSATSSLISISENVNLTMPDNYCNYHNSSSVQTNTYQTSPVHRSVPSLNKRNGNSFTDITISVTPGKPIVQVNRNVQNFQTPKSVNSGYQRRRLYDSSRKSAKVEVNFENDDIKNRNTVSSSTDSLTGSSSNDIETSDSFVNIKFAQVTQGERSSSTQSIESTDSFENICFSYNQDAKNDNVRDLNENGCNQVLQQLNHAKNSSSMNEEKTARKTRPVLRPEASKSSHHSSTKTQDIPKCTKNEVVKLRHGKHTTKNETETRIANRNKRFSCLQSYSSKKVSESVVVSDKLISSASRVGRKFSSTDELQEEKQKQSTKTKRFSLYYTPQPLRKNYESDTKAGKTVCKNLPPNRNDRQNNGKSADSNRKKDDVTEFDEKKNLRNRGSMVDGSTVASRSKSSKQSVHIRSNLVSPSLIPGRTK